MEGACSSEKEAWPHGLDLWVEAQPRGYSDHWGSWECAPKVLGCSQGLGPGRERAQSSGSLAAAGTSEHGWCWQQERRRQLKPSLCCCGSNADGTWELGRKPLSPSSHLPVCPKCPPSPQPNRKPVAKGDGETEFGELRPPFRGVGSELRDSRFTPEARGQRIWSQKTWVLASVLPERMAFERLPNLPYLNFFI